MKKLYIMALCSLLGGLVGCTTASHYTSIDVERFAREIDRPEVQLVDVRTPQEYAEGHIEGALNMDVQEEATFDQQIATLDKSRPVALYCRSGHRSKIAAERAAQAGFEVIELDGGYRSWIGEQ